MKRTVFFVSDGTAITAETLGHTLLTQFDHVEYRQITMPFIDNIDKASRAVDTIDQAAREDGNRPVVFSTLINLDIKDKVASSNALVLDLFNVFIRPLEVEFSSVSTHTTGRSHGMVDTASYQVRIDAVNFALRHDDGASTQHYEQADIILVGVSRSGKTPTCIYLAMQFGIRAANYPLTVDDLDAMSLPDVLKPYSSHLFGLTIDPERLQQIRKERRPNSVYSSLNQCRREVKDAEALFQMSRIPFVATTSMSIEEIASRILQKTELKRRLF